MENTSNTELTDPGSRNSRARTVGTLAMVAGVLIVLGALVSIAGDWAWPAILIGFALLIYVVPQLHRSQAPADRWPGTWGSWLVVVGGTVIVTLGVVFLVWEAVGQPGEPAWVGVLWMVGFFAFVLGILLFGIGSALARKFPLAAPLLMLIGLLASIVIDMATGAFFEEDSTTTEWGFYIGVPLFGLGVAWMGYALRSAARAHPTAAPNP